MVESRRLRPEARPEGRCMVDFGILIRTAEVQLSQPLGRAHSPSQVG